MTPTFEDISDDEIVFADTEGNDLVPGLTDMWLIQLAIGVNGEVIAFADQPGYRPIREALVILKNAKKVVFHNGINYDFFAINKLYPGTLRWEQVIDTLILSRLRNSVATRHSLRDLAEDLGMEKGNFNDFSQFSEAMVVYGIQDVKILQAIWKGKGRVPPMSAFWRKYRRASELEFYTSHIMTKQYLSGFRFDYEGSQMLEADFRQEEQDLIKELQEIFPPIITERISEKTGKRLKDDVEVFNPGSRDQIASRLITKYGWKPTVLTPGGSPKVDESVMQELPYPEAKSMARYLVVGKKLGMISDGKNAWQKCAVSYPDGSYRIHGSINTLGARTHRMSHFKPNVAQADSDPRMRCLFLADRDWDLVGVDAEGLELRELAHFLEPYDHGVYVNIVHSGDKSKGTDIHTVNRNAAGLYLRDSAKTMIYAHNYGCFDKKLGVIVINDAREAGKTIPKGSPSALGKALRSQIEVGIVGLGQLIEKCKKSHHKVGALPGHDSRWIPSASDHSALNTLLQGNGSIVMKQAVCEFDREMERLQLMDKFAYCANVHDEYQLTSHPDFSQKVAEVGKWAISQAGEVLDLRCPLVGDAKIGRNWSETH